MRRLLALAAAASLLLFMLGLGIVTWEKVRDCRRLPTRSLVAEIFSNEWPHHIAARILLLKSGSNIYHVTLREWIYGGIPVANTPWNRWLLERDARRMTPAQRSRILPKYPLRESRAFRQFLIEAFTLGLTAGDVRFAQVTSQLGDTEGHKLHERWIRENILKGTPSVDLVRAAAPFSFSNDNIPLMDVLRATWRPDDISPEFILQQIAAQPLERRHPVELKALISWMDTELAKERLGYGPAAVQILTSLGKVAELQRTIRDLSLRAVQHLSPIGPDVLTDVLDAETRDRILPRLLVGLRGEAHEKAVDFVAAVAARDILLAEKLADPALEGPDTPLRKDLIVELVKSGSVRAVARIDDAFRGEARRKRPFRRVSEYIFGSVAADAYRDLAGHDYLETGKTWPPSRIDVRLGPDMPERWRQFITEFPWFPGTDDAYYRLAYTQSALGDLLGALETLKEYFGKELPDTDADPYAGHLLRVILLRPINGSTVLPGAHYLRAIVGRPLGVLLLDENPDWKTFQRAIQWALENDTRLRMVGLTDYEAKELLDLADLARVTPRPTRLGIVLRRLVKQDAMEVDFWTDNAVRLLYGSRSRLNCSQDPRHRLGPDPSQIALELAARHHGRRLRSRSLSVDEIEQTRLWIQIHRRLLSGESTVGCGRMDELAVLGASLLRIANTFDAGTTRP